MSKTIEQQIHELVFKNSEFDMNDYCDWAMENSSEAYQLCLGISNQLQAERDSLKEQLEISNKCRSVDVSYISELKQSLESSERENKELKENNERLRIGKNNAQREYVLTRNTLREIESQLSSLKEQADKLEGALENVRSKNSDSLIATIIHHSLSTYKQSKG